MLMKFCGTDCLLDNLTNDNIQHLSNHILFFNRVNNNNVASNNVIKIKEIMYE